MLAAKSTRRESNEGDVVRSDWDHPLDLARVSGRTGPAPARRSRLPT
jgi:hypothetical protein